MLRAMFLAIGLYLTIMGLECLIVDRAVLSGPAGRELIPPEWAPWSLLSAGAITVLYSFTVPQRVKG